MAQNIQEDLAKIINNYPIESGQCSQCAREIYNLFIEEGLEAQVIRIETDFPFLSTKIGLQLSRRIGNDLAYHEFVRVNDTIYDALTGTSGMAWSDY